MVSKQFTELECLLQETKPYLSSLASFQHSPLYSLSQKKFLKEFSLRISNSNNFIKDLTKPLNEGGFACKSMNDITKLLSSSIISYSELEPLILDQSIPSYLLPILKKTYNSPSQLNDISNLERIFAIQDIRYNQILHLTNNSKKS